MIKQYQKKGKNKFRKFSRAKLYNLIEITNDKDLCITFADIGASIYSIYFKNRLITFTPLDDFDFFCFNGFHFGKTLGRTAGRIKNGIAIIDGKEYKLNKFGDHTLHGAIGFQFKQYNYDVKEVSDEYQVIFSLVSEDGDQGYPGNLDHKIIYHFKKKENQLEIEYIANTDKDTLCNLSNHVYWQLDGDIEKPIFDHYLQINADRYIVIDNDLIYKDTLPLNEVHNFNNPHQIKDHLFDGELQDTFYKGYDHDYLLTKNENEPDAILESSTKDVKVKCYSSYPVCHLFTANCFGEKYKYHAVALEFQKEIFHQEKVILRKDEQYHETIKFIFE